MLGLGVVAALLVLLPLAGLLVETPWSALWSLLSAPSAVTALRLSLVSPPARWSALLLGVPLA